MWLRCGLFLSPLCITASGTFAPETPCARLSWFLLPRISASRFSGCAKAAAVRTGAKVIWQAIFLSASIQPRTFPAGNYKMTKLNGRGTAMTRKPTKTKSPNPTFSAPSNSLERKTKREAHAVLRKYLTKTRAAHTLCRTMHAWHRVCLKPVIAASKQILFTLWYFW